MKKFLVKPLDFVITPMGQFAFVSGISEKDYGSGIDVAVEFIGAKDIHGEGSAWFDAGSLKVIDSLPSLLARLTAGENGDEQEMADRVYIPPPTKDY